MDCEVRNGEQGSGRDGESTVDVGPSQKQT